MTPWTAARQASLPLTVSQSLLELMSIESMMPSNHIILCHPLSSCPHSISSITVFSNEWTLRIRWPKSWSFSFSISLPARAGVLKPWCYQGSWLSCRLSSLAWVRILPCHLLVVTLRNSFIQLPSNLYFFICRTRITKVQVSWVWCRELMKSAQNVLESQDSVGGNSSSSSTISHQIQFFKKQNLVCLFWSARLLRSWCLPVCLILSLHPLPPTHNSPPILVCLSSSKEAFGLQPCTFAQVTVPDMDACLPPTYTANACWPCSPAHLSVFPDIL